MIRDSTENNCLRVHASCAEDMIHKIGFTCWCFIIFCAAGVHTLPLVSTNHGSAAATAAKAAAVVEEAAAAAGSAAAVTTAVAAVTAMATEAGATAAAAAAAASSTWSTCNFFFK